MWNEAIPVRQLRERSQTRYNSNKPADGCARILGPSQHILTSCTLNNCNIFLLKKSPGHWQWVSGFSGSPTVAKNLGE